MLLYGILHPSSRIFEVWILKHSTYCKDCYWKIIKMWHTFLAFIFILAIWDILHASSLLLLDYVCTVSLHFPVSIHLDHIFKIYPNNCWWLCKHVHLSLTSKPRSEKLSYTHPYALFCTFLYVWQSSYSKFIVKENVVPHHFFLPCLLPMVYFTLGCTFFLGFNCLAYYVFDRRKKQ